MFERVYWIVKRGASFGGGAGESRSISLRLIAPLTKLASANGCTVKTIPEGGNPELINARDIVFFCRHSSDRSLALHEMLHDRGIFTVYDIDDLVGSYPAYFNLNGDEKRVNDAVFKHISLSRFVTVENSIILESVVSQIGGSEKFRVLPNAFDFEAFGGIEKNCQDDQRKIIFTNAAGLKFDSFREGFFRAVNDFCERYHYSVHVFSDLGAGEFGFTHMVYRGPTDWRTHKEILCRECFDFSIVPLGGIEDPHLVSFNSAKSIIKYIEYGATKIPSIFSNVEPYKSRLNSLVNSILVENTYSDWLKAMERLIVDRSLKERLISNAYKDIRINYSVSKVLDSYSALLDVV